MAATPAHSMPLKTGIFVIAYQCLPFIWAKSPLLVQGAPFLVPLSGEPALYQCYSLGNCRSEPQAPHSGPESTMRLNCNRTLANPTLQHPPHSDADISRIIEMAWEDRTAFEVIATQFGLNESAVVALMRRHMKPSSFRMWRKRMAGRTTKHAALRGAQFLRHCATHTRQ
jgi:uncharacterized protein (TIGR03643 family)